jgi:predicted aconitase with swiveling domain
VAELKLTKPLSFWGGLDPGTGRIVDRHHPQYGECISGRKVFMDRTCGSTNSPGTLVEAIRLGNGPAEIVLREPDMTVLSAVRVAKTLYDIDVEVRIQKDG